MTSHHRRHTSVLYPGSADALALGQTHDECRYGGGLDPYLEGPKGNWYENPELARQLQMGNAQAADYVQKARSADLGYDQPQPFPDKIGTPEWYDARHMDHLRRHQGDPPPPSYYLDYGKKYCLRFSDELYPKLSRAGQAWVVATRTNLQILLEEMLHDDPEDFAELELDDERFRITAFRTHAKAYRMAGLLELPTQDLLMILATPDLEDIASAAGMGQILQMTPPVAARRRDELFEEPRVVPSRDHTEAWWRGSDDVGDVPYQTSPELPLDSQCALHEVVE